MRSLRKFLVRHPTGSIQEAAPQFTTGLYDSRKGSTVTDDEIVAIALEIVSRRMMRAGALLTDPRATQEFLRLRLAACEYEVFGVCFLDARHCVIAVEELFTGTIDGSACYPREVVKAALRNNAAAVIFFHNHPSQNCESSNADQVITSRLKQALETVDIRVLDHLIVSAHSYSSFAERGLL